MQEICVGCFQAMSTVMNKYIAYSTSLNSKSETKIQLTSNQFWSTHPLHREELMFKEKSVGKVKSCAEKEILNLHGFFFFFFCTTERWWFFSTLLGNPVSASLVTYMSVKNIFRSWSCTLKLSMWDFLQVSNCHTFSCELFKIRCVIFAHNTPNFLLQVS